MIKIDAVILAGGKMAIDDPLYEQCVDGYRSMIDIMGKPMVQWVIDALDAAEDVADLYIVGLQPDSSLQSNKPLKFLEDQGDIFENARSGVIQSYADHPERSKVIVASADIPAVKHEMINWFTQQIAEAPELMLYYNIITAETMEAKFPHANRSYVRFKDVAVCGGDLNAIDKSVFAIDRPLWQKLAQARKTPLKQAGMIGFDTLFLIALRLITLQGTVKKVCRKLDLEAKAYLCPFAEMGMDADKPHQLEILKRYLEAGS